MQNAAQEIVRLICLNVFTFHMYFVMKACADLLLETPDLSVLSCLQIYNPVLIVSVHLMY